MDPQWDEARRRFSKLTPTQIHILQEVMYGKTYKAIAYERGGKTSTISTHVTAILGRLQVNSITAAIALGVFLGMLKPELTRLRERSY